MPPCFDETEAFLKKHGADLSVAIEDIDQDSASLRQFLSQ